MTISVQASPIQEEPAYEMTRKSVQRAPRKTPGKTSLLSLCVATACCCFVCLLARPTNSQGAGAAVQADESAKIAGEPVQPIPVQTTGGTPLVALGRRLFEDTRLSHDNTISCASCHGLDKGGTDQRAHSVGIHQALGGVNAPSVFNSGLNFKQFWNGRAETLEDQVEGPTQHPKEMGSAWPEILQKVGADARYQTDFRALFADGVQRENIKSAIAAFERALTTPNAPFDRYLRGDSEAINAAAKQGYKLFKDYGCASCHQGVNVGGNMFARFGVMADYFAYRGNVTEGDYGRWSVTHREQDRYVFRVPSLRNVALTYPYLHDGTAPTLDAAIQMMGTYQLGRYIEPGDAAKLAEFLRTLTGELNVSVQGAAQ